MAKELVTVIRENNRDGKPTRGIIPCGPKAWYEPFAKMINKEKICLKNFIVFHMDECFDWEGKLLKKNLPFNFKTFMEKYFYGPIEEEIVIPEEKQILVYS